VVAALHGQGAVSTSLGIGGGVFAASTSYAAGGSPQFVAVADVNGDSTGDLLVANFQSNSISLLAGRGDGTFQSQVQLGVGANTTPHGIAAGDLNGDGKPDLAVADAGSNTVAGPAE